MFTVQMTTEVTDVSIGYAIKIVELPFVPMDGLTIKEKSVDAGTVFDEYTIGGIPDWDVESKSFECQVYFGLGEEIEVNFKDIEPRGWMAI